MRGQGASGLLEISAISDTHRCASGGARRIKALRMATAGIAKSVEAGLLPDSGRRRAGAQGFQHRPLRIGIDATCWRMRRGFGRHARCLLGAMLEVDPGNEYLFFIDSDEVAGELPSDVRTRVVGPSTPSSRSGARRPRDLLRAAMAMSAASLDVIVFPAIYSYVPVFSRARKIVMVHDTTADEYPEFALHSRCARVLWSLKGMLARRQADALLAVSEYARSQIVRRFALPDDRIGIVGEAPDRRFRVLPRPLVPTDTLRQLGFHPENRAIVYVGGFSPHKNLESLVQAFAHIASDGRYGAVKLFLVGDHDHDSFFSCYLRVKEEVAAMGLEGRVIFTGYLPDDDLVVLLNLAEMLVLPSMNEGFGLPAAEAAACGCPVVATTASPLRSILGDAMLSIDPRSEVQLRDAIIAVLSSGALRERMRAAGPLAAARLSWEEEARRLLAIIAAVASR
jgi:glycosyltransferase involved in cell wall biosynthesis